MNNVQLVGRLTRDPDVRILEGGVTMARFTVAVDRVYKRDGEDTADFISCVSFGKTADFVQKYFNKGQRIGLTGRIQTGSYEKKEGNTTRKVYTTDVVAERVEFVESKQQSGATVDADGFMEIPDGIDDELPFD